MKTTTTNLLLMAFVLLVFTAACSSEGYGFEPNKSGQIKVRRGDSLLITPPYEHLEHHKVNRVDYYWEDSLVCSTARFPFTAKIAIQQPPGEYTLYIYSYYDYGNMRTSRLYLITE